MEDKKQKDEKTEDKKKNNEKIRYFPIVFRSYSPFFIQSLLIIKFLNFSDQNVILKEIFPRLNKLHFLILSFIKTYVFDPSENLYYKWLIIISFAVLYNYIFIVGRASFELLQDYNPIIWLVLDYSCDFIYLLDIFVRLRTGQNFFLLENLKYLPNV